MQLDLSFIRQQFPAFSVPALQDQAFFENAGGSYTCQQVADRLARFYRERKVQPYGPYPASRDAGAEMDEARNRLSALLGVEADELSFGPSTTQNTYVLAQAFGQWLSPGDAVIVTNQDHEANSGPWRRLADRSIEIREWRMNADTGHLNPDDLDALLSDNVRLVCFPHCSNVVGEMNDVAAICAKAHLAGAFTCVDGVSYVPHGFPDIGALGADIYLFSAYKTYGPHQGIMTVRRHLADLLPNQAHFFNGDSRTKKFTPAGPDHAQVAASAGMVDYVEAVFDRHFPAANGTALEKGRAVHDLMRAHECALLQPLLDYLSARNDIRLIGPNRAEKRAPTVAFELPGNAADFAEGLARHNIMAGGGDFYAVRALQGLGIDPAKGVLRLSFVHYTSPAEIDAAISALDHLL